MRLFILSIATLWVVSVQAADVFQAFTGHYEVDERWCDVADTDCYYLLSVEIRKSRSREETLLVETYRNGGKIYYRLWEGTSGNEQASISGTEGKEAIWTHSKVLESGEVVAKSLTLYRAAPDAPLYYAYNRSGMTDRPGVSRHFRLAD